MKKEIKDILTTLENASFQAYIVGGYVRNKLLGRDSTDVDIITNALVKDIVVLFKDYSKKTEEYGNVKLILGDMNVDITTYRKEDEYINNKPTKVEYINDLYTDLLRRDFTINTLCMDKNEIITDTFDALNDLHEGVLYSVGDVNIKFKEDTTRMLRAIRFMVTLNFSLSKDILEYIINNKEDLSKISYTKRKEEIDKIFLNKDYMKFVSFIKKYDLEKYLGIKISKLVRTSNIIGFWSQIEFDDNYQFNKLEKDQIIKIRMLLSNKKVEKYDIYTYGSYICMIASTILGKNANRINKIYQTLPIHSIKDIDITAKEITTILNINKNKISIVFKELEKEIINGKIKNSKKNITSYLLKRKKYYE